MILVGVTIGFALGFLWGRRQGVAQGFTQGLAFAPLDARRDLWENTAAPKKDISEGQ